MTRISGGITYQRYTNDEFIFELRTGINQIHACLHANNQTNSSDSCCVEEHHRSMVEYILSLQVFTSSSSSSSPRSYSIHCSNREKKNCRSPGEEEKKFVDSEIDTDRQGSIQTLLMQEEKRRSKKRKEKPVITITIVRLHLLYRFCLISTRSSFL